MNASLGTIHNYCTNQILICCILHATWKASWLFLLWHSYVIEQKEPMGVDSSDMLRPGAHFTNNVFVTIQIWWHWITAKWYFHRILIVMAKSLVKWVAEHFGWYLQTHFLKQEVLRLDFYPRTVLAFGYCHHLHLSVYVCVYVCVRQSSVCPDDNLSPTQAAIIGVCL